MGYFLPLYIEVENRRAAAEAHRTERLTATAEELRTQLETARASLAETEAPLRWGCTS
jgi:hypothetical protein